MENQELKSQTEKIAILFKGIIYFIEEYNRWMKDKGKDFKLTDFITRLNQIYKNLSADIKEKKVLDDSLDFLKKYNFDINNQNNFVEFFDLIFKNKDSLIIITLDYDFYELLNNSISSYYYDESTYLNETDINDAINIYFFFKRIKEKMNKTDKDFFINFNSELNEDKYLFENFRNYVVIYNDILDLYYDLRDPEYKVVKEINNIMQNSKINIFINDNIVYTFGITNSYLTFSKEILQKKLKVYKIFIEKNQNKHKYNKDSINIKEKEIFNKFSFIYDNLNILVSIINNLFQFGYPKSMDFCFLLKNNLLYNKEGQKIDLQDIINQFQEKSLKFKDYLIYCFENFPLVRLFHGKQFSILYSTFKENKLDYRFKNLINSVSLNKIKNFEFKFLLNNNFGELENINNNLKKIFNENNIGLDEIYKSNKIFENINLCPGLYRKVKYDDYNLFNNIVNIYLNLTYNIPIINTVLICNEKTTIEEIISFLYRAFFCDLPILFLITNIEKLPLFIINSLIKSINDIFEYKKKKINSYVLFIYKKENSNFSNFIEKLIPDNILDNFYSNNNIKNNEMLKKIELYSSKYSGYGKTKEILKIN